MASGGAAHDSDAAWIENVHERLRGAGVRFGADE
jgi:hypothetical protein